MAADPVDPELIAGRARNAPLTRPRPGHADLAGMTKFGFDDARPVLERASARETASRVVLGTVARAFLKQGFGVDIVSHVVALGHGRGARRRAARPGDLERVDASPVRAFTDAATAAMVAEVDAAQSDGDTLGGVVEVIAYGLPVGIGSYVHSDRRLDARLAGALMGIQAMKGVEIGDGFRTARRRGSAAHDEMVPGEPVQPADQPGRRHRGRHDQRRAGPGAGGDEADLHRAPGAAHRRRGHRRGRPRPSTSAPTCARCRRPGWSRRPWSRWCWPTRRWRSSAATRWPRPGATCAPTWTPPTAEPAGRSRPGRRYSLPATAAAAVPAGPPGAAPGTRRQVAVGGGHRARLGSR